MGAGVRVHAGGCGGGRWLLPLLATMHGGGRAAASVFVGAKGHVSVVEMVQVPWMLCVQALQHAYTSNLNTMLHTPQHTQVRMRTRACTHTHTHTHTHKRTQLHMLTIAAATSVGALPPRGPATKYGGLLGVPAPLDGPALAMPIPPVVCPQLGGPTPTVPIPLGAPMPLAGFPIPPGVAPVPLGSPAPAPQGCHAGVEALGFATWGSSGAASAATNGLLLLPPWLVSGDMGCADVAECRDPDGPAIPVRWVGAGAASKGGCVLLPWLARGEARCAEAECGAAP